MVKLIIRDDDLSYFANAKDLNVYDEISKFPISYAVVPHMLTNSYDGGMCEELKNNKQPKWIGENIELVDSLIERIKSHNVEILLHGYSHEYKKIGSKIVPEFMWRNSIESYNLISIGKKYLEDIFNININWFAAPSNVINSNSIRAVIANNINFSGIITPKLDRPISKKYIQNYFIRWGHRLTHDFGYPGILDYGTHKEIYACPIVTGKYLYNYYRYCKHNNLPMVVNSHYWDIRDNNNSRTILFDFVKYALADGAKPSLLSDII